MRHALFASLLTALGLSFCQKGEPLSDTPAIKFVSASSTELTALADSLTLTISYEDGDGDLGENNPDAVNCLVQDSRSPSLLYQLRIKQLAPTGANIAIKGELALALPPTGLVDDNNSEEPATFTIKVIDRAGNVSNRVSSPVITIRK